MPIPCPHFKISIVKRSQGQSAVAGAAYQSGERLFSEYDQKMKFYNKKKELVHAEIMLPPNAPPGYADRATLWNAVEAVENQWNSQLARRIVLAFPREVPKDQHLPIDQAESEKSPSAFVLSQAEIENALRRGSNVEGCKLRIWKIYQLQPDRKLRAKALANEYAPYGPGGSSHTYLDGSSGWLDHDSNGLTFEHYPDHQKVLLRWDRVEKYIDLMIQSDRYLSDKERRAIDFPLELNAASAAE